jgi:hypothetical protein
VGAAPAVLLDRLLATSSIRLVFGKNSMPETQKQWIKRLTKAGWELERGGKHQVKMTKPGCRPITLPENKRQAYSKGFEAELRKQAALDKPN